MRRVPGNSLRWEVCSILLRQRDVSSVLLRVLLGCHPLTRRPRVSQAPGEGGRRSTSSHLLPLELSGRQAGSRRAGSAGVANHCTNKCTFLLLVPFCSNFTEQFSQFVKLIYIYILKIEKKNWNNIQICPARKQMCNIILFMRLIFEIFFISSQKSRSIGRFEV